MPSMSIRRAQLRAKTFATTFCANLCFRELIWKGHQDEISEMDLGGGAGAGTRIAGLGPSLPCDVRSHERSDHHRNGDDVRIRQSTCLALCRYQERQGRDRELLVRDVERSANGDARHR